MALLDWLQNDPEKQAALRQGLISAGVAMMQGGRQDFGTALGQGLGAGVKTYAEKFDEARKKALAMAPYKAAMTPAKPAVPAVYKVGGQALPQKGQAQEVAQNMYNIPQAANPYKPPEQDMYADAMGMPQILMPQGMGAQDMSGGEAAPIEEVAAQPATPESFDWRKFEDAVLQDPTHPAYQKLVESRLGAGKKDAAPSNVQEWEFYNSLPPKDQARFLEMKRAVQTMDLGDRRAVRAPGGGIQESYPVAPKPTQPNLQYVPGNDYKPSGVFNPRDGKFMPSESPAEQLPVEQPDPLAPWAGMPPKKADEMRSRMYATESKKLDDLRDQVLRGREVVRELDRFGELNRKQGTGGITDRITSLPTFDAEKREMEAISSRLAPFQRAPGSGASSDRDVSLFLQGLPGIDKQGPVNKNIREQFTKGLTEAEQAVDFAERYFAEKGHLNGWNAAYKASKGKTPPNTGNAKSKDLPKKPVTHPKYPGFSIVK